jgi:type IV pilus biogenesis protein PilP
MCGDRTLSRAVVLLCALCAPMGAQGQTVRPEGGPAPVTSAGPAVPAAEPPAVEAAPVPPVLREIGIRQTELSLLELEVKRAELQKRLRDLDQVTVPGPASLPVPPPLPVGAAGAPSGPVSPPADADGDRGPRVLRIHRIDGRLKALVRLRDGETRDVGRGNRLPPDLEVVEVSGDAVLVRRGQAPAHALAGLHAAEP